MAASPVATLAPIDYLIMAVYFAAVLGIRDRLGSGDYTRRPSAVRNQ